MIVSDKKRIIETPDNDNLNGIIGWCDTVGAFIVYPENGLDGLEVIKEIEVSPDETWGSKSCEDCSNFYTCDNMGWYQECQQENYKHYERDFKMIGIMFKYGDNDFEYTDIPTDFTKEDEEAIFSILAKYNPYGTSIRGTGKEVCDELMNVYLA